MFYNNKVLTEDLYDWNAIYIKNMISMFAVQFDSCNYNSLIPIEHLSSYYTISLNLCSLILQGHKHTWGRNWQRLLTWIRRALTSSSTVFWLQCLPFSIHRDWLFSTCISLLITKLPPVLYLQWQQRVLILPSGTSRKQLHRLSGSGII